MKPILPLLAVLVLAGCSTTPAAAPTAADAATRSAEPATTAAKPAKPGGAREALAAAAAVGKPYRIEAKVPKTGSIPWQVYVQAGGASKVVMVKDGTAGDAQAVTDDQLAYHASYGDGLGSFELDSDEVRTKAVSMGLDSVDSLALMTAGEYKERDGGNATNAVWVAKHNSVIWSVDAVTGSRPR
jgi:hypothetical protein